MATVFTTQRTTETSAGSHFVRARRLDGPLLQKIGQVTRILAEHDAENLRMQAVSVGWRWGMELPAYTRTMQTLSKQHVKMVRVQKTASLICIVSNAALAVTPMEN